MNRQTYFVVFFLFLFITSIYPQIIPRAFEIKDPAGLELAFGGIIAGVDFDGDGLPEIYTVNTNFVDRNYELIPRIYKFEWNPSTATWDSVWGAQPDIVQQNTYPALAWGDLDKDGKPEIYWGPSNFLDGSINPNPYRIVVYEYPGDGSDNMGVDDGFGGWLPNAQTTIINTDMFSVAPIKFVLTDIDGDGNEEIIFSNQSAANNFHMGVVSVDDIPDNGGGLENWTLKFSGEGDANLAGTGAKWDFAVVDSRIWLFNSNGTISLVKYENGGWVTFPPQFNVANEDASFRGSLVVDLNNDGNKSIFMGGWFSGKVYLLDNPNDADTLVSYEIADFAPYCNYIRGAAVGDIDNNGKPDLIFGSRYNASNTAKVPILRVEYQGGDKTNPANYIASIIDSAYWDNNGDMLVVATGNLDGDAEDEVLYTQGYSLGNPNDDPMPIIVLDANVTPVSVEKESDIVPAQFYLDQNFPNPFNPTTEIKFGITKSANVDLRIYDVLGKEVAVLINNEYMSAGSYNVKFDASKLASGNYVYSLTAGSVQISKKMQLLK
ncbi:MAG: FG-GAP-like repeat-containing protein [Ignavibacterium sp.]|jgi:hypothetical protein|nr:FG-GAP-like repeat-containing protein [Ignavibacterium sp.]